MGVKGVKTGALITAAERKKLRQLGATIRIHRNERGWTLEDVETQGYKGSWQHWREVESGLKNINLTTLLRIAKVLNVKPAELLVDL